MVEGFVEWLWEVLSERWRLWAIVISALAAAAVIIFVDITHSTNSVVLVGSDFSKLLLTAIVASVILKILVIEGYFKTSLSQIVYEDRGLKRLTPPERLSLWRELTIIVYAPFLNKIGHSKESENLRNLAKNLSNAVTTSFNYKCNYYHKDWKRTYELNWEQGSGNKIIVMRDTFRSTIIPFTPAEPVDWEIKRIAEAHLKAGDYESIEREIKINGHEPDRNTCNVTVEGRIERRTYALCGHSSYDAYMLRDIKWYIDDDPTYSMAAIALIDAGDVEIINNAKNLQIVINEVGGTELFKSNDKMIIWHNERYFGKIKSILLPEQGFQLLFIRQKEAPETAPSAAP